MSINRLTKILPQSPITTDVPRGERLPSPCWAAARRTSAVLADLNLRPPYNAERTSAVARLSDSEFLVNPALVEGLGGFQFAGAFNQLKLEHLFRG
jgi:hypothetical protein